MFSHSVHVAMDAMWLTLGDMTLPPHPYSILWPGFPRDWAKGQDIAVTAEGLFVGDRTIVPLTDAERFAPSQYRRPMAEPSCVSEALLASQFRAALIASRGGLHEVFLLSMRPEVTDRASRLARTFSGLGARLCVTLSRFLRLRQWEGFERAAGSFVGMGVGLTPAGDDFLAGVLAVVRYHGKSLGQAMLADAELDAMAARLAARTTAFSGFLLRCAARGLVARPLSDWLDAVHGGNAPKAVANVDNMAMLGHSSGLDAFSGMLLAMQILIGERSWART